jgi:hypothetical protein
MKIARLALVIGGLLTAFVLSSALSFAKPEYTKKEKKPCTTCHTKQGSKELNEKGQYYKKNQKLPD